MNRILVAIITVSVFSSIAYTAEEQAGKGRIGLGKAVVEASEKEGIRLSPKAMNSLQLTFLKVTSPGRVQVPRASLVRFQDFYAVYRKRGEWFRMIEIEPSLQGASAQISSPEFAPGDEIVVGNTGLLRVVDLDVWGPEADACAD